MTPAQLRARAIEIRALLDAPLKTKEDLLALFCLRLGFTRAERPLAVTDRLLWGEGEAARLAPLAQWEVLAEHGHAGRGGFAVLYAAFPKKHFSTGAQAVLVRQLRQSYPEALFVFANVDTLYTGRPAAVHFVYARLTGAPERAADFALAATAPRLVLRRFRLGPGERTRTTAEQLARLAFDPSDASLTASDLTARCDAAFNKEALTQDFFKKLDHHLRALESDLVATLGAKPSAAELKDAFTQAQLLLERLIFLYFAQNRGWLEQRTDWFVEKFRTHRARPRDTTFYAAELLPLFRSLARPDFPGRLDGVPFLNGGLFDEDDFDSDAARLSIRNTTFAELFDDLLEAYNFTVREDTPLSQEVAVDPEMLGKIFESIVLHAESAGDEYQAPDKRKATGSYYTPRIVVHFICREALRLWFASRPAELADPARASEWPARISTLFREIEPADGRLSDAHLTRLRALLSPAEAARGLARLKDLRTLDPSVGSGAFPVGLLHELVALHQIFEAAANGYKDPAVAAGRAWRQHTKAHYIEHALFGVDLQQQAVEICRLRLWLSLLVDYELEVDPLEEIDRPRFLRAIAQVSQLPNLEMNFKRGDSLIDHLCGRPVTLPAEPSHGFAVALQSIEKLGLELHRARAAERKRGIRLEILRQRYALSRLVLAQQAAGFRSQLAGFDDMFGGSDRDRKERARLEAALAQLAAAEAQRAAEEKSFEQLKSRKPTRAFYRELRRLEGAEMDGPHNFAWQIDFPHVLAGEKPKATVAGDFLLDGGSGQQELTPAATPRSAGGFDLVLGNPPFVTARNEEKRDLYRARWPRVCRGKYLLICPFFELSFGLLRPGGQLGFIVSNAFAKREFGQPLVENFFPTVNLQKIVDCSGLMFPGHGTPTCIVFGRGEPPPENTFIRVAATLPGGGDLRTPPEDSLLWLTLEERHDQPGYEDDKVAVGDRPRNEMAKWPWIFDVASSPTLKAVELATSPLIDFLEGEIGFDLVTGSDDFFVISQSFARRTGLPRELLRHYHTGENIRDWLAASETMALFPYKNGMVVPLGDSGLRSYASPFKRHLESRIYFGKSPDERGMRWWEYAIVLWSKRRSELRLAFCQIATHAHFVRASSESLFKEKAPIIKLPDAASIEDYDLLSALLNSSAGLFWLKQVAFPKRESESGATGTYFEFAGNKIDKFPIPVFVAEALRGKAHPLTKRLAALSCACWESGRQLPSLALRHLFAKNGEAYHAWNAALPGHVAPAPECRPPFATAADLRARLDAVIARREHLRAAMIALQEEMDWGVYRAHELTGRQLPVAPLDLSDPGDLALATLPLQKHERPFALWATAGGDFDAACALIPRDWPAARRDLWRARLTAIRDNEHLRRLEQPVYKRRWDEQWKVGNRWTAGPAAYAAEFVDAFHWWLSEKAEHHLETTTKPEDAATLSAALWKDARIRAAWAVTAESLVTLDTHKARLDAAREGVSVAIEPGVPDPSEKAFTKFLRDLVREQSVLAGIPAAQPWEDLAARKKYPAAELKRAEKIRGKLNVPRERFAHDSEGRFRQAAGA